MGKKLVRPILTWVGGKRQLLKEIEKRLPKIISYYVEPFVGGGAVVFDMQPQYARINDYNKELINVYRVVRDNPDALIEELKNHEKKNDESGSEWFYFVRGIDRMPDFKNLSDVKRAARMIYLNKTCYSGKFKVNSAGQFNNSYARYKHPNIVNEVGIRALHGYFCNANIEMCEGNFADCLIDLPKGAFVYLDPPYMHAYTGYTQCGFGYDEQVRLRDECVKLREQGIHFLQSNSDCEEIRELYKSFKIETVYAKHSLGPVVSDRRGTVKEVLISG